MQFDYKEFHINTSLSMKVVATTPARRFFDATRQAAKP
jgi:hypothetical protein